MTTSVTNPPIINPLTSSHFGELLHSCTFMDQWDFRGMEEKGVSLETSYRGKLPIIHQVFGIWRHQLLHMAVQLMSTLSPVKGLTEFFHALETSSRGQAGRLWQAGRAKAANAMQEANPVKPCDVMCGGRRYISLVCERSHPIVSQHLVQARIRIQNKFLFSAPQEAWSPPPPSLFSTGPSPTPSSSSPRPVSIFQKKTTTTNMRRRKSQNKHLLLF